MDQDTKRTWAEINLDNIAHNMKSIQAALPEHTKLLGIVKADAYGHGAVEVSRILEAGGAGYLAVSCLDEALELRSAGIGLPILILGHTPAEFVPVLPATTCEEIFAEQSAVLDSILLSMPGASGY